MNIRVRKRDGRVEAFDSRRLVAALFAALQAAGEDGRQAVELADSLTRVLAHWERPVEAAEIATAVKTLLEQGGCSQAARGFGRHRAERERRRNRIRVHDADPDRPGFGRWDRGRLARSLLRSRSLKGGVAARIAARVEKRLLGCGLVHVTTRLVAALCDNECRALGLRGDVSRGDPIGPDRNDLRAWLGGKCLPPGAGSGPQPVVLEDAGGLRPALGGEILARFALEEVLDREQARLLEEGLLDLPGIGDWLRPACLRLAPGDGEAEEAFWDRVAVAAREAREVQVFWPSRREASPLCVRAPGWIAPGGSLRLATDDPEQALAWGLRGLSVRLARVGYEAAPAVLRKRLASTAQVSLFWRPGGKDWRPHLSRDGRLDSLAVLNLSAAAAQPGGIRAADFLQRTWAVAGSACRILGALAERNQSGAHARVALLPAALPRALACVAPGQPASSDRVRRILLALRDILERQASAHGLRLRSTHPPRAAGAGARLAFREGLAGVSSHPVGWVLGPLAGPPSATAFDTAPWLEFPLPSLAVPAAAG